MAIHTFQITGNVNVEITITEMLDGTLKIDLDVLDDTGQIGDLRGLFFDLADDSLTGGMSISGADVTDERYKINGVTSTGGSNNIKGEVLNAYGKFDVGVEFGTQGISKDDIRSTSFILSHDSVSLSLADLEFQDVAVRLMSVGSEGGSRDGSLKLGGEVPEVMPDVIANDDVVTVFESEGAGDLEVLDSGATSVLANDTSDGTAYQGDVIGSDVGISVVGSNGGFATIFADGTIDFDANDEFDFLAAGQTASTVFSYEIEGGATAHVTVNVLGEDDPDPEPQPVINLAIMLNSAQTMYATAQGTVIGVPAYPDVNGDGAGNQLMDMAYLMLNDFMSDAFDVAASAGVTLNVSLISFDQTGLGEGGSYFSFDSEAAYSGQLAAKVAADDSADHGQGFENADAWFDTVSTTTSTNAVWVISDGFTSGPWVDQHAQVQTDHNALIDTYFPDLDIGSAAGVAALNLMDDDGFADQVFTDDAVLASSIGSQSALDILSITDIIL